MTCTLKGLLCAFERYFELLYTRHPAQGLQKGRYPPYLTSSQSFPVSLHMLQAEVLAVGLHSQSYASQGRRDCRSLLSSHSKERRAFNGKKEMRTFV